MNGYWLRTFKRFVRGLFCRRPLIPKQPGMIVRISSPHVFVGGLLKCLILALDITGPYSFRHIFDFPSGTHLESR